MALMETTSLPVGNRICHSMNTTSPVCDDLSTIPWRPGNHANRRRNSLTACSLPWIVGAWGWYSTTFGCSNTTRRSGVGALHAWANLSAKVGFVREGPTESISPVSSAIFSRDERGSWHKASSQMAEADRRRNSWSNARRKTAVFKNEPLVRTLRPMSIFAASPTPVLFDSTWSSLPALVDLLTVTSV